MYAVIRRYTSKQRGLTKDTIKQLQQRIDHDFANPAEIQPLRGEIVDERIGRTRVGEHPARLCLQDGRLR